MSSSHEPNENPTPTKDEPTESSNTPESSQLDAKHVSTDSPTPTVPEIEVATDGESYHGLAREIQPHATANIMVEDKAEATIPQVDIMPESHKASIQQDTAEKEPTVTMPIEGIPEHPVHRLQTLRKLFQNLLLPRLNKK